MLNKIKNRKQEGFTIIEVLIVLAIAGLIMLIVFLAVPALQRNSRNTEVKNEANRMATGINEFISNANGKNPSASASTTANSDAETIYKGATATRITKLTIQTGDVTNASDTPSGIAIAVTNGQCNGNIAKSGGTARQAALQYGLEGGQSACIQI
ncbi:MAG: prepilin-type N-terminal cleavage/methylation domain-containing protein [Candidatus Saccharibacteria bacterium]|nr:prepilin-type N-terminal cleavage/methylation domain-containing protein [Candidatus Saccharibacteria bacterium]